MLLCTLCVSCKQDNRTLESTEVDSPTSLTEKTSLPEGRDLESFTVSTFTLENTLSDYSSEPKKKNKNENKDRDKLELPSNFTERDFLYNPLSVKDNLDHLVGAVVKREKSQDGSKFRLIRDYKMNGTALEAKTPINGVLIERSYDHTIGSSLSYLVASAKVESNIAYLLMISDVSEMVIRDNDIDRQGLFKTYGNDSEIDNYFIVKSAVTTSILYKTFKKMKSNADFSTAAINVSGKYYSQSQDLRQDWKVGISLIPLNEFLKDLN